MNASSQTTAAKAQADELRTVKNQLVEMRGQFTAHLPPGITAERFTGCIMLAVQHEAKLLECDRKSLFLAALRCANDGLIPDGREAALVPYNDKKTGRKVAQHMPMIAGIVKLARNSGEIASVAARCVHENDYFSHEYGDEERIDHRPPALGEPRGKIVGVYAIVKLKDGTILRDVMSVDEVERRRHAGAMPDSPAWVKWWDEQAMKTVLRHCLKRAPRSTVLDRVLRMEAPIAPPTPIAAAARAVLPDPESFERTVYNLKCQVLEQIGSCETLEAVTQTVGLAKAEFRKLEQELPIEIEAAAHDRQAALEQLKAAP